MRYLQPSPQNINRAIGIADYILEDEGHSTKEAAKEFKISVQTVKRSIYLLGKVAYTYDLRPDSRELKIKYKRVLKTLETVSIRNKSLCRQKS